MNSFTPEKPWKDSPNLSKLIKSNMEGRKYINKYFPNEKSRRYYEVATLPTENKPPTKSPTK